MLKDTLRLTDAEVDALRLHVCDTPYDDAPLIYFLDPNTEYEVEVRAINS